VLQGATLLEFSTTDMYTDVAQGHQPHSPQVERVDEGVRGPEVGRALVVEEAADVAAVLGVDHVRAELIAGEVTAT
jgi:hypothetical protein